MGGITAATVVAGTAGVAALTGLVGEAEAAAVGPPSDRRADVSERIRVRAAEFNRNITPDDLQHPSNGDEERFPFIAMYSKGLPHDANGEVDTSAYLALVKAMRTGRQADFNAIPLAGNRRLVNPQAGLAFDLQGADSHRLLIPPAPAFNSKTTAAEIAENYWMALLRDVPFSQYATHPIAVDAAADLDAYGTAFKGARTDAAGNPTGVTTANLFRGVFPGDLAGPWLSQFFLLSTPFGANEVNPRIISTTPGVDYMTDFDTWLAVQRGVSQGPDAFNIDRGFMRNGRDIGEFVHIDVLFQAYFQAFLVLASLRAPLDENNPYNGNPTQEGFGTFGGPHIATLLCEVSTRALKAIWYQKWRVHRRLRPEALAGRIDRILNAGQNYPIYPQVLDSLESGRLSSYFPNPATGSFLLPMAFPEGSPLHPAYGSGHATVAGACVTILKAFFNESTRIVDLSFPNGAPVQPVVSNDAGTDLEIYTGADAAELTVGGELNKIASNVAIGRNIAGVHWRSDATEAMRLGEAVAISILRDQRATYNEAFNGFSLTKFDGTTITV
ncbi:MAG: vanadium-dependent haloperoxidase [Pseudomonadota bacterium]|nr:vanadium-dependent haloperoxidase [Pseudomonadota bacterium]